MFTDGMQLTVKKRNTAVGGVFQSFQDVLVKNECDGHAIG